MVVKMITMALMTDRASCDQKLTQAILLHAGA